jgi:hypothetical protein
MRQAKKERERRISPVTHEENTEAATDRSRPRADFRPSRSGCPGSSGLLGGNAKRGIRGISQGALRSTRTRPSVRGESRVGGEGARNPEQVAMATSAVDRTTASQWQASDRTDASGGGSLGSAW